jgi:hypothetical protein
MIQWLQDEQCGIALDTRHHPVVISSWQGLPGAALVDRYYSWSDATVAAALAAEQQLLHIADLSYVQWPSAAVRMRVVNHRSLNLAAEVMLATIVVCGELAERLNGFVRSVGQLSGGRHSAEMIIVQTVPEAIEVALERMWSARIPPPLGLDPRRYQTPRLDLAC